MSEDDRIDMILSELRALTLAINGNGQPGIKTRLDRLEQWVSTRVWVEKIVAGLLITAALVVAWKLATMHPEALTAPLR